MKKYKKFYEIENNRYYLLPFDNELHLGTENVLKVNKRFLGFTLKREISQGFKLLEISAPLLILFQEIISANVDKLDEQFPDMTTYVKVDNVALRKEIEDAYKKALDETVFEMRDEFEMWLADLAIEQPKMSEEEFMAIEEANKERLEENIRHVKDNSPINFLQFKWKTGDNSAIKKLLEDNKEYLYTQKIGSNYKITYLYDLDIFGTVTIYKIHCVKDTIKSIETFIYNRELLQEMFAYIENHRL